MDSRNNTNPTLQGCKIRRCLRRRNVRTANQQIRATSTTAAATANLDAYPSDSVTSSDPIIASRNSNAHPSTTTEPKTSQTDTLAELGCSQSEDGESQVVEQAVEQVPEAQPLPRSIARNPVAIQAARILFRECQPTQQAQPVRQQLVTSTTGPSSIVNANRRLIERQIEAIQEADSRRWNFDFGGGIPLAQPSHRYVNYNQIPLRNCRPLIDQNQSSPNRFEQSRPQHRKTSDCQNRSDHKQDDV